MATHAEDITVVHLSDEDAEDARLTGGKAANLARAARAGLPVLPGFVLVPGERAAGNGSGNGSGNGRGAHPDALYRAWNELSRAGTVPLVVRSSSACEDTEWSSMAGRFASVLDVHGWGAFNDAVRTVFDSAGELGAARDMSVLVQSMLACQAGGVLFGADPVEGRTDRIVISAVHGGPHALVSGTATGTRYRLTSGGRLLRGEPPQAGTDHVLDRARLRRLGRLGRTTHETFGAPQDVEFGFDADDRLWLFQSRPITAMAARPPRGARLLGPGPVAETFPGVLQPLEEDLWLVPMSRGLTTALDIAGAAPRRLLARLRVATTVDGLAAADLRLLGTEPPRHRWLALFNPLPGARLLGAAWRVGRLKAALPLLAVDLMADVDAQLADVPPPHELGRGELMAALSWGRRALAALHAQESLAGALLGEETGRTAAAEALSVLAHEARRDHEPHRSREARDGQERPGGPAEGRLLAEHPVLLALTPPAVGVPPRLPAPPAHAAPPRGTAALPVREALRLRVRWVQEMQARLVWELAGRMERDGTLPQRAMIGRLTWAELTAAAADGRPLPADLAERAPRPPAQPLPARFRLADGRPVAEPERRRRGATRDGAGQGAGGGRGGGTAWDGTGPRPPAPVLVVRTLDPSLAPLLPGLAGLVAETGSVLSHLAVLAREYSVPTAVGVPGAVDRYPPGTPLTVDGRTGEVHAEEDAEHIPEAVAAAGGVSGP
jgi:rifampicin phosphotransferase